VDHRTVADFLTRSSLTIVCIVIGAAVLISGWFGTSVFVLHSHPSGSTGYRIALARGLIRFDELRYSDCGNSQAWTCEWQMESVSTNWPAFAWPRSGDIPLSSPGFWPAHSLDESPGTCWRRREWPGKTPRRDEA
jgi:hypothetical protein